VPVPTPGKGERSRAFISRCVSDRRMVREFPDVKQRLAVCYSELRKKRPRALMQEGKVSQDRGDISMDTLYQRSGNQNVLPMALLAVGVGGLAFAAWQMARRQSSTTVTAPGAGGGYGGEPGVSPGYPGSPYTRLRADYEARMLRLQYYTEMLRRANEIFGWGLNFPSQGGGQRNA